MITRMCVTTFEVVHGDANGGEAGPRIVTASGHIISIWTSILSAWIWKFGAISSVSSAGRVIGGVSVELVGVQRGLAGGVQLVANVVVSL